MKKALMIVLLLTGMFIVSACQTTTESLELTLTGTIFLERERIYNHFIALDFTSFTFDSAKILMDVSANPPLYIDATSPEMDITAACASMFANYSRNGQFPFGDPTQTFAAYVTFTKDNEQLIFNFNWGEMGSILLLHIVDDVEVFDVFPLSEFPTQMATLLTLLSIESSV